MTFVASVLCLVAFVHQNDAWQEYEAALASYCEQPQGRLTEMVIVRAAPAESAEPCIEVLLDIETSRDPAGTIQMMAEEIEPFAGMGLGESRDYALNRLRQQFRQYQVEVPAYPGHEFAYFTDTWNPIVMVTSRFAHESWLQVVFNLFFFFAFAMTAEVLIGSFSFIAVIVAVSIFSGGSSSLVASLFAGHQPTLGLAGVVMGMMGLCAFLLPQARIRCYYWLILAFGSFAVPAWLLAVAYIGWDTYQLLANAGNDIVGLVAHLSGAIAGYLYGLAFLTRTRQDVREMQLVKLLGEPPVI
jgi:membrane associated rhomboid family serine protease